MLKTMHVKEIRWVINPRIKRPKPSLITYLASNLIIVEVHQSPCVLFDLPRVDEHFGEAQAVADICRAASPLPALVYTVETLLLLVAAAVAQVALRTGGRDGVGHPSGDDGVGERGLFTA